MEKTFSIDTTQQATMLTFASSHYCHALHIVMLLQTMVTYSAWTAAREFVSD